MIKANQSIDIVQNRSLSFYENKSELKLNYTKNQGSFAFDNTTVDSLQNETLANYSSIINHGVRREDAFFLLILTSQTVADTMR